MNRTISVNCLNKTFRNKHVLKRLSLNVEHGEMVALIGASGSGKSTLLRHLSGLTRADNGDISILEQPIQTNGKISTDIRLQRARIGYIFQQFNLVGRLSVLDNVLLGSLGHIPRWRGSLGLFSITDQERAYQALDRVGLLEQAQQRASTLSGGQQQRVAIARVLTQQAQIILADEPIASLDPESARTVMDTLADINQRDGKTVVVTLHQVDYARRYCPRTIALKNGEIHYDGATHDLTPVFLADLYSSQSGSLTGVSPPPPAPHLSIPAGILVGTKHEAVSPSLNA